MISLPVELSSIDDCNDENYHALLEKIKITGDINATDEYGRNLFHFAAEYNQVDLVQKYRNNKITPFKLTNKYVTPLHLAAEWGSNETVKFLLKNLIEKELLQKNYEEMNALHVATEWGHIDAINALLNDERFKERLQDKDLYGRTAFDIALQKGNDQAIRLFTSDENFNQNAEYGTDLDLSQNNIEAIILNYLEIKHRKSTEIVDATGNCNGWEFLYEVYLTAENEDKYFNILKALAKWDGTKASLKENLSEDLAEYKNLEALFEQTINDLVVFHSLTKTSSELNIGLDQNVRHKQYKLIKNAKKGRKLRDVFSFEPTYYSQDQLAEQLLMLLQWPNMSIDIKTQGHAMSLYITPEGEFAFNYYDPNYRKRVPPFTSAQALAEHIFKFALIPLELTEDNRAQFQIDAYKFYRKNEILPHIEKATRAVELPALSANGYTELHRAILSNDLDKVKELINQLSLEELQQCDKHLVSPIRMAIRVRNEEICQLLVEKLKSSSGLNISQQFDFTELASAGKKMINAALEQGWISVNDTDRRGNSLLFGAVISKNESIVETLLAKQNWDLKTLNAEYTPVIFYALGMRLSADDYPKMQTMENQAMVENETQVIAPLENVSPKIINLLLKSESFDINQMDDEGWTPLMLALEYRLDIEIIRSLLAHKNIDVNIRADDEEEEDTALMTAIRYYPDKKIIALLLEAGADKNITNYYKQSAYDLALKNSELSADKQLMERLRPSPLPKAKVAVVTQQYLSHIEKQKTSVERKNDDVEKTKVSEVVKPYEDKIKPKK